MGALSLAKVTAMAVLSLFGPLALAVVVVFVMVVIG